MLHDIISHSPHPSMDVSQPSTPSIGQLTSHPSQLTVASNTCSYMPIAKLNLVPQYTSEVNSLYSMPLRNPQQSRGTKNNN